MRDADRETVFAVSWRIALAILDTLEPLEAAELIHRDIKAANIIDRGKELGLTDVDFLTTREQVKQTGDRHSAVGTPTTMTPEMMTDSHRIDHTTDPYGGACTVYGFMGGRLGADTIDEIANERIWGWFIQRIEREFKEIADHCPERAKLPFYRLRTWLTHALAQFPSRRPQTIHEHRELLWDTPNSSMV